MQRPIKPDWLVRQAYELAGRGAPAGQPRNTDLRRAVSAAYYALFHEICLEAACLLLPRAPEGLRHELVRHVQHAAVIDVCKCVLGQKNPARSQQLVAAMRQSKPLLDVAIAYQALYEARHEADYDHTASFTRPTTLTLVNSADDAIAKLRALAGADVREMFLALIMTTTKSA